MSAREEILGRVRVALSDRSHPAPADRAYRREGEIAVDLALFVERVEDYRAKVHRVPEDELGALLARLIPGAVVAPNGVPEEWLHELRAVVRDDPPLDVPALDRMDSVLTTCAVAIAETGTVVLNAGPGQGRRALTLVPDHHVVVVRADDVVANVPDALPRLDPSQPQTWISGPSATSDIELDRVEGVHGPRRLDVVLLR